METSQMYLVSQAVALVAPVNTVPFDKAGFDPSNTATYTGWTLLGHLASEDGIQAGGEDPDREAKGSFWTDNIRTQITAGSIQYTLKSIQLGKEQWKIARPGGRVVGGGYASGDDSTGTSAMCILARETPTLSGLMYLPNVTWSPTRTPDFTKGEFFSADLVCDVSKATADVSKGTDKICLAGKDAFWYAPPDALTA